MRGGLRLHFGLGLQHRPLPRRRVRIPTFAASDRVADVGTKSAAHAGAHGEADSFADGVAVRAPDSGTIFSSDCAALIAPLGLANQCPVISTVATAELNALGFTDGVALSRAHILPHGATNAQPDSIADGVADGAADERTHVRADEPADDPPDTFSLSHADLFTHNPTDGLAHGDAHGEPDGRAIGFTHGASDRCANGRALGHAHLCSIGVAHNQPNGYADGHADGLADRRPNPSAHDGPDGSPDGSALGGADDAADRATQPGTDHDPAPSADRDADAETELHVLPGHVPVQRAPV